MMAFGRVGATALLFAACTAVPMPLHGQDSCPAASGAEAEAGWVAFREGDLGRARSNFQAALDRCGDSQYARTGLGYVELRQGTDEAARSLFQAVVLAEPDNVDALVGLGLVHWREADLDAARARFSEVLAYDSDHPTALEYLGRLSVTRTEVGDEADQAWSAGDLERARRLYVGRLDTDPSDAVALLRLALMHGWDGDFVQGMELLDRLITDDPMHLEARLARARLMAWAGDLDGANRAVLDVLEMEPDNQDARAALALIDSWTSDAGASLDSQDQLVGIGPEGLDVRSGPPSGLSRNPADELALASYQALVAERPDDVEARIGLARALSFAGEFQESIETYRRALEISPGDVSALVGLVRVLGWAGRLAQAERTAVDALDANGEAGSIWAVLAEVRRWQGRTGASKEALDRAVALSPNDPRVRDQLRSVDLTLAPRARTVVRVEDDSDGNRMVSTSATASAHPFPRLRLDVGMYRRDLEQVVSLRRLERSAQGLSVDATYELDPGWKLAAGLGGSTTSGVGDPSFVSYRISARSPSRRGIDGSVALTSFGLDETAAMAERGVRATLFLVSGRWQPTSDWRVDGQVGLGSYEATQSNGRRSALLTVTRLVGESLYLGAGLRGFSFEKDLLDGYFDPEFYGIVEASASWIHRPLPWTFKVEVAPGVERVDRDGEPTAALRGNAEAGYRITGSGEVTLGISYSTASVTALGASGGGYRYLGGELGVRWVFD